MTHPDTEELMDYLYGELDVARRGAVAEHVAACEACKGRLATWGGVRRELDTWELPDAPTRPVAQPRAARGWPVVRWAVAASVLLATGYGLARLNAPQPSTTTASTIDTATLRDELKRELRAELGRELKADHAKFASEQSDRQAAFRQAVADALEELDTRQVVRNATLRRDMETVALRAREELDQLASSTQTGNVLTPPYQQQ